MTRQPAIEVRNLSKRFRLRHSSGSLKNLFLRRTGSAREDLLALNDVSFTVQPGETVAVIGRNGSGKSTLLGILARVYRPLSGEVVVRGRVAPLLELGAGFHEDLTGLENISLHGSILGMTRARVLEQTPAIIEFAELEHFIDTPIRGWSAGMVMRLGFSIAVHSDPDLLLVDEVLAVGDEAFQAKCYRRIAGFQEQGKTILFVSHDLEAVRRVAARVLWISDGRLRMDGPTGDVVSAYHTASLTASDEGSA